MRRQRRKKQGYKPPMQCRCRVWPIGPTKMASVSETRQESAQNGDSPSAPFFGRTQQVAVSVGVLGHKKKLSRMPNGMPLLLCKAVDEFQKRKCNATISRCFSENTPSSSTRPLQKCDTWGSHLVISGTSSVGG